MKTRYQLLLVILLGIYAGLQARDGVAVSLLLSRLFVLLPAVLIADLFYSLRKLKLDRKECAVASILVLALIVQCTLSMRYENLTYDESAHIGAGYAYLTEGEFRIGGTEGMAHFPLVRSLSALPLMGVDGIGFNKQNATWFDRGINRLGNELVYGNPQKTETVILYSRLMVVALSMFLGLYVFLWSARLYGTNAGLLSLFLYAFNPMVLAHSKLVTIDIGSSLFFFAAVYYLWNYSKNPSGVNLSLSGISLGLGVVAKISGLLLLPLAALLIISVPKRKNEISRIISLVLISLLVVNTAYGFKDILRPLGSFKFDSSLSKITTIPHLKLLPVPLPEPFVLGLDYGLKRNEEGHISYFLGKVMSKGVWYYYLVLFLIKNPIPLLLLMLASLLCYRTYRKEYENDIFILTPVILIFTALSLGHVNIGLRYALPAFPFIFVHMGRLVMCHPARKVLYLLCFFYLLSSVLIYPHYLAYFNELVGGPDGGVRYAVVADLDWGQDMKGLAEYVHENNITDLLYSKYGTAPPDYYGLSYTPLECGKTKGFIAIHAINLMRNPKCNGWLMEYTPVGKIGYSIFLYNISD